MKPAERIFWAVVIVIVDLAIFAIPLTAIFAAYILVVRPSWFRNWVEKLYRET